MATTELFRDEYSRLSRVEEHRAIELHWFAATKSMPEARFRQGLERLASTLEKDRVPNVLIDVVEFAHQPEPDFTSWRDRNIIPRYNGAGVRKFAFVMPTTAAHTVEHGAPPAVEDPGKFPTAYFNGRPRAYAWFDETAKA